MAQTGHQIAVPPTFETPKHVATSRDLDDSQIDVLICGSGSAGLCAATWLAQLGLRCKVLESRDGPMVNGQADGVQCRTVEVFESFNMSEEVLREGYHVIEVDFWATDGEKGQLKRINKTADTLPGLSHQPHIILNQARINGLLLGAMRKWNHQEVDYGYRIIKVDVDSEAAKEDPKSYACTVVAERDGQEETFKARYVLGCDGAHSTVRRSLGYKMIGDSTDVVWGVMDLYPRTNFPDIRKKATLQSENGNLLLIPREGGSLVRFYVQMPAGTVAKEVTLEELHKRAKMLFCQFDMEFAETTWWSAYSIGQRLADHFAKDNRVFLTGDACHTHSPKAGQGMNTSLQDGYNMGWKLGAVLKGQAGPELLETYTSERSKTATELINFDRTWSKMFGSKASKDGSAGFTPEQFSQEFIKAGRYMAGLTSKYEDSIIVSAQTSKPELATNLTVGMRLPSTQIVRHCDAKAMHLVKALPADGRWRVLIFAGEIDDGCAVKRMQTLATLFESSTTSPITPFTPSSADIDSLIEPILVLNGPRINLEQEQIPLFFSPVTGRHKMRNLDKVLIDDESYNSGHGHAYDFYGVDPKRGAMVVIRPDQYVSLIVGCDEEDVKTVRTFFEGWALKRD